MSIPDEVVIEALLKDARRFKSKWELQSNEPNRCKPNVGFLKRTINNVVKTNKDRIRRPRHGNSYERDIQNSSCEESSSYSKSREHRPSSEKEKKTKKSKNCFKSKYRSPHREKSKHKSHKKKKKKEKERDHSVNR